MRILVQKFGGSSVSDLEKLQRVAEKIVATRRSGYDLVVVVSAMGSTTDELLERARQLHASPSRRELDMLLSVGERISMTLLSIAVHAQGLEAVSLTGSQCGIITTASHANARIIDVRPFRVQDELAQGKIVIVAGYQGTSYRREVTTLGRGGSDTTAVALAAALDAEACEIYSDVDGVFSADPRVVLDARQLLTLSYEEMMEMARSGAKVLHEQAVEFARQSKIALYARSTHDSGSRGTIIRTDGFDQRVEQVESGRPGVSVSHVDRGLFVQFESAALGSEAFLSVLDLDCAAMSYEADGGCRLFLRLEDVHDLEGIVAQLDKAKVNAKTAYRGLVSLVGYGIGGTLRWAQEASAFLDNEGIGADAPFVSLFRISWVVSSDDVHGAAEGLHRQFVAQTNPD